MPSGIELVPTRSNLAYANQHRSWRIYEDVFNQLASMCRAEAKGRRAQFRFKHLLLSLDSTTIPLCLSMFEWAKYVRTKGAVKLHLVLDHQGFLPQYAVLSEGRKADIAVARKMEFQPGTMLVFDRGYEDHNWWRRLSGLSESAFLCERFDREDSYLAQAEALRALGRTGDRSRMPLLKEAAKMKSPRGILKRAAEETLRQLQQ